MSTQNNCTPSPNNDNTMLSEVDIESRVFTPNTTKEVRQWTTHIQERVKTSNSSSEEKLWKNASIYKVPIFFRELNRKAFTPELVTFGPFHHDKGDPNKMQMHKERALEHFIKKANKPFEEIVKAVTHIMDELQDSYYLLDEKWRCDRDGFLKLMIVDGCFMLEVLRYARENGKDYSPTDPYFSSHGIHHKMPYIRRDMLLIENQLPMLLLKTLVAVGDVKFSGNIDTYVNTLVLEFVAHDQHLQAESMENLGHHALEIYRRSLINPRQRCTRPGLQKKQPVNTNLVLSVAPLRCADELREAGVRFRPNMTKSFVDISFDNGKGILYLPELMVDDATECTLLNVMAFENLHTNSDHHVTSYVCFMDEIIDSPKDVCLLHTKKIIKNSLGSDKNVSNLFNRISKELTTDPENKLIEVRKEVNKYCEKQWKRWWANFQHTYLRSPWTLASVIAAVFVIMLAIVQTVFSILQYIDDLN